MSWSRLLARNLLFHWRGNLAVLLGVIVGTAVLTGALLVGDSLRGSLRERALGQLGWVRQALTAGRFFRAELADELAKNTGQRVCPALLLQGALTSGSGEKRHAGRVTVLGVDERFWAPDEAPVGEAFWNGATSAIVLSAAVASELGVAADDAVVLHLQTASALPREFLLSRQSATETIHGVTLRVAAVLAGDTLGDRFTLTPSPAAPRNAFVPLAALQAALTDSGQAKRGPLVGHPVNGLLAAGDAADVQSRLADHLTLDDWGLTLQDPAARGAALFNSLDRNHRGRLRPGDWPRLQDSAFLKQIDRNGDGAVDEAELVAFYGAQHPYFAVESDRLFLETSVANAVRAAGEAAGLRSGPTLVYLADRIAAVGGEEGTPHLNPAPRGGGEQSASTSYAIVAALDPSAPAPLGPFLPRGVSQLSDDEIALVEGPGIAIPRTAVSATLGYYDAEEQDVLRQSAPLRVRGRLPIAGAADDPGLTPQFPGITDQASLADWDPPPAMHYNPKRVRPADEDYWRRYRTTPKAYVNLATGQRLWGSRFGSLTSVRLAPMTGPLTADVIDRFRAEVLRRLKPEQAGLMFMPVRERALASSAGAVDFGELFVGFSLFLIVAALLLVGLLFRLNLDRRAAEAGVLVATGMRRRTLRGLYLAEGAVVAAVGSLAGMAAAAVYARWMVDYLRRAWPGDGLARSFLGLHVTGRSLAIGYGASLLVTLAVIVWGVRVLGKVSPRALLAGEASEPSAKPRRARRWLVWVGVLLALGAVGSAVGGAMAADREARAEGFFTSGMLLLAAALVGVWRILRREPKRAARHVATIAIHNAGRHPGRSLLTAGLLAAATFLVVAVQSFRQEPGRDFLAKSGGSGGFGLFAESDIPVFLDPQSARGRADWDDTLEQAGVPKPQRDLVAKVPILPLRLRAGEDVSCLNLYQPSRPRLLGVPAAVIERGGFRFQATLAGTEEERGNPWRLLGEGQGARGEAQERDQGSTGKDRGTPHPNPSPHRGEGAGAPPTLTLPRKGGGELDEVVPVFAEANTAEWVLHKKLGDTIEVPDEQGVPRRLRIVGLLKDSIFQSELVMAEGAFRRLYPHEEGYRFFLLDVPPSEQAEVKGALEQGFASRGLTVMAARQRLESYLAVENTYLSTFQALGSLGVLLGALGLGVVLLRGVWERRGELALLRALGFRRTLLSWMVLAENGFLLVMGVGAGAAAALVAVAPYLASGAGSLPWLRLAGFLGLVLLVGLAAGGASLMMTLRAPLLPALRRE